MIKQVTSIKEVVEGNDGIVVFGHTLNPELSDPIVEIGVPQISQQLQRVYTDGRIRTGRAFPIMYNQLTVFFCTYAYAEEDMPIVGHFLGSIDSLLQSVSALNIMRLGVLIPDSAEIDRVAVMTKLSTLQRRLPLTLVRFYEEDTGALL